MKLRNIYDKVGVRALNQLPPEVAHSVAISALSALRAKRKLPVHKTLQSDVMGKKLDHPFGIAAGFDKNAKVFGPLLGIGAAHVEVGAVTPLAQPGNPKPRLFRLPEDEALINRMGFNNQGLEMIAPRLERATERFPRQLIGANLGPNATSKDRFRDYETLMRKLWGSCDFLTINVSSPNTRSLRDLEQIQNLGALLFDICAVRDQLNDIGRHTHLCLKVSPDMSEDDAKRIAEMAAEQKLDAVIATNTTVPRDSSLKSPQAKETGGLSGKPQFENSTRMLRTMYSAVSGSLLFVGVGGVDSPEAAYAKLRSGASLVQIYTSFIYRGPGIFEELVNGVHDLLSKDGYSSVSEAIGVDC